MDADQVLIKEKIVELRALGISCHLKEDESSDVRIDKCKSSDVLMNRYESEDVRMNEYDEDSPERNDLLTPVVMSTGVGDENREISISDSDDVPNFLIMEEPTDENQLTSEEDDCCVPQVSILTDKSYITTTTGVDM